MYISNLTLKCQTGSKIEECAIAIAKTALSFRSTTRKNVAIGDFTYCSQVCHTLLHLFKAINEVSQDVSCEQVTGSERPTHVKVLQKAEERKQEVDVEQLFRSALTALSEGQDGEEKSVAIFMEVLQSEKLPKKSIVNHPNIKFACLKNLMKIHEKWGHLEDAFRFGMEAVEIDDMDISLLHRLGRLALTLNDFDLALHFFRIVLDRRSSHWLALDAIVRLTYALTRFEECLKWCSIAMTKDNRYRPAFYCVQKILEMQPSLKKLIQSNIIELQEDTNLHNAVFNDVKFCETIEKFAETVREELRRQIDATKEPPRPLIVFPEPLHDAKWSTLLHAFSETYDKLLQEESLHVSVDLKSLIPTEELAVSGDVEMEVDDEVEAGKTGENVQSIGELTDGEKADDKLNSSQGQKLLSPVNVVTKLARSSNIDETLVEKRRSSRVCVTSTWSTNISPKIKREKSDSSEESPVSMLNSLLLNEIREWSEEDKKASDERATKDEGMDIGENSQEESLGHVDDGSKVDVQEFLRNANTNSLMHHTRDLLLTLATKYDRRWPRAMLRQYSSLFESVLGLNFQHTSNVPEHQRMNYIQAYIFALELQADKMETELEAVNRQLKSEEEMFQRFPHLFLIHQWLMKIPPDGLFYKKGIVRIRWLDFITQSLQKDQLMAECTLDEIRRCLKQGVNELRRPNCSHAPVINESIIEQHLIGLTKCVGIAQLRALADDNRHEDVLCAWEEENKSDMLDLTPSRCDIRLIVHRAFAYAERWTDGWFHGLASIDAVSQLLQVPSLLADSPLDGKSLSKFAASSLRLTALCWDSMQAVDRARCRRSDSARAVISCCFLIQNCVSNRKRMIGEEVWLMLFDQIQMLEDGNPEIRRSTARNRAEEMDLVPSLTCLFIGHDYLASHRCCTIADGRFLRKILHITGGYRKRCHERYLGDADDVEWLFMQALACLHGVTRKSKTRVVDDHRTEKLPICDYTSMQIVYNFFRPDVIPEFDSIRSLSIGADVMAIFKDIVQQLGQYENKFGLDEQTLDILVTKDSDFFDEFKRKWTDDDETDEKNNVKNLPKSLVSKEIYYLLADFHFKSRFLEEAAEYYRNDLRFNPMRFDSWAALSLARLSLIQKCLDQQDFSVMENTVQDVNVCMHGFECALKLNSKCSKLMVENGTVCYEIYSYSDRYYRQWQLRGSCSSETLLRACCQWRRNMLSVAQQRFSEAMSCGADDENELWYYSYMKGKCGEKSGRCLWTEVMPQYRKALRLLHKIGAKYPRRVFFYGAAPPFSLETIEVFYRCHAALIKRLLRYTNVPDECPDLDQIEAELKELGGCEFAQTDRVKGGHKRGRNKGSASVPVSAPQVSAANRRSKRRFDAEESCPTSEAEVEAEEVSCVQTTDLPDDSGPIQAANQAIELVMVEVDRHIDLRECIEDLILQTVNAVGEDPPSEKERKTLQWERCILLCLNAFELLTQRIPHHYKAVRQVAQTYLFGGRMRNTSRALEYLWTGGTLEGAKFPICALFKDRKDNNLFNGIYRNPIHDLDRCGNFSHHMKGCVDLLLRSLRERCDWVGLKEVCLSLHHSIPEVKNVCITESELLMFQRRAFSLCLQSIDQLLHCPDICKLSLAAEGCLCALHKENISNEHRRLVVYKLWRLHRQAVRSFPHFKYDSFRCVARAFFMANVPISTEVPVIQQIRDYLQLSA